MILELFLCRKRVDFATIGHVGPRAAYCPDRHCMFLAFPPRNEYINAWRSYKSIENRIIVYDKEKNYKTVGKDTDEYIVGQRKTLEHYLKVVQLNEF